ncbi:UvrD-helicase domain-containing protein [Mesorhizobium sp. M4B.F.Ca.ET.017.02.2.1]|uniref:UvrD-helicase domain-containing protein n=1 Tax=Mesorhizobium sp. M4B.F.Ca.ET.017.02.2.1 TaxID=2496649 RepID=UPI0016726E77|nr:UvrD-helicase domain-containing protein [Mesorhizobium sp. M4B.F.Ca.ET.017.02.2.1]
MNIQSGIDDPNGVIGQVAYFTTKEFDKSLSSAFFGGGQQQKKATKVKAILGSLRDPNPFISVSVTNHGETRVQNAVKYDLGDGWRLITQQTDKTCLFLFVGDHEDADKWLDGQKGMKPAVRGLRAVLLPGSGRQVVHANAYRADHHDKPLVERLDVDAMDHVLDGLQRSIARKLEALDARSSTSDLEGLVAEIPDLRKGELVHAVFNLLLSGNYEGAQAHVDLSMGRIGLLGDVDEADMLEVADGEDIRRLRIGSPEYEAWLASFEKRSSWHEWFLYLHPEQERVVMADYAGVSQLSGVSGSGKTCVAVRRALRLAEAADSNVLLLTLNRSLAGLLRQLVDAACSNNAARGRIEVTSFFELAQRLLHHFEPHNDRHYVDVTWKSNEHVDLIFREYYRQWLNNESARVLVPLHKSMTARGVGGEAYLRDEFDWIRSAVTPHARSSYLGLERKGRKFPIAADRRSDILKGLDGWEQKMRDVGVVDYLGLTSALARHLEHIRPRYTNILVDEAQDFGSTELQIVRRLVEKGPNDIFLCGDIAQTILPKHRSLPDLGLVGITRERIKKNYRNSREILKAAYEVLSNNLNDEMLDSEDLEILDPQFANFSGPVPMALAADTLEQEVAYARAYAATALQSYAKTACIAFAGFSSRDVKGFAEKCGVTSLDGAYDPSSDRLVFCDLEQTKGYEFDSLIILNCRKGVLPPHDVPEEEAYRASCKLYVAMTRARRELILSFNGEASPWIAEVRDTIGTALWSEFEILDPALLQGLPELLPEIEPDKEIDDVGKLTGLQFLYTAKGLGLSLEAQDKLIDLVDGRGLRAAGGLRRLRWQNMRSLVTDLNESRLHDLQFGPNVAAELRQLGSLLP